jgi:hypothetical protein
MAREGRGLRGIATVIALGVGLAVGYLAGASRVAGPPGRSDRASPPARDAEAPERPPPGETLLARALREIPSPEIERGAGTITGEVTRPDGTPVAGVALRAVLRPLMRDDAPPHPLDLEDEVRRFVADFRRETSSLSEVTTGPDGRYGGATRSGASRRGSRPCASPCPARPRWSTSRNRMTRCA